MAMAMALALEVEMAMALAQAMAMAQTMAQTMALEMAMAMVSTIKRKHMTYYSCSSGSSYYSDKKTGSRIDYNSLIIQRRIGRNYRISVDDRQIERMMFALVHLELHRDAERLLNFAARIWEAGEHAGLCYSRLSRIIDSSGFYTYRHPAQSPLSSRANSCYELSK